MCLIAVFSYTQNRDHQTFHLSFFLYPPLLEYPSMHQPFFSGEFARFSGLYE